MKEPIEDLLQRVLDGSATVAEYRRLESLTAADPELRRRREELEHVFTLLGSARLTPPPERLREAVLEAIADLPVATLHRAPKPAGGLPRGAGWFRIVLPVSAALAAVLLVWAVRTPWSGSGASTSGTMAGKARPVSVSLGVGPAAMVIEGRAVETGIEIELRAGAVPGVAEITAMDERVTLSQPSQVATGDARQLSIEFEAGSRQLAHGRSVEPEVPLRIVVRFTDGRAASATMRIPTRRALGPGG